MRWNEYQSRRKFLSFLGKTGVVAASAPALGTLLSSCAGKPTDSMDTKTVSSNGAVIGEDVLGIKSIGPSTEDNLVLSESLQQKVLLSWGDKLNSRGETFGYNNDYLAFVPFDEKNPNDGMFWSNHEYPQEMFVSGYKEGDTKTRDQVKKEMDSVGGSLVRIRKKANSDTWEVVQNDHRNRRITGQTMIPFAWNGEVKIKGATKAMGTLANCAGGITPWKTVLTCEENWNLFYGTRGENGERETNKYYDVQWWRHFDNPPEHYGWVVEVNPQTGEAKKLVAMGRLKREGATVTMAKDGRPVVYSGDDRNGGCIYKYIGTHAGSLETGTLYVADVKKGKWIPLDIRQSKALQKKYKNQLEVLVNAREASLIVGGTEMDRPEDVEINPVTKDIVVALTNNKKVKNYYGSLFRMKEKNSDPLAMTFESSTLLAGGPEVGFACPDNLEFDQNGNLWFTTDISEGSLGRKQYKEFPNNGLFLVPLRGKHAGRAYQIASGPTNSELTGVFFSPDYKTLFMAVQHPGSKSKSLTELTSHWPEGGSSIPKPAVVQIYGSALEKVAKRPDVGPIRLSLNLFRKSST